jgi:hypothetical protein
MFAVTIRLSLAPGKVLLTDAVWLTPEELRAEHARYLYEEWLHFREESVGTWHDEQEEGRALRGVVVRWREGGGR